MSQVTPATYHAALVGHHEGATVLDDLIARFDARMSHPTVMRIIRRSTIE